MAVQAPRLWDAYQVLDIMSRGRRSMKCVAKCRSGYPVGRRCNWDIKSDLPKVENLLQAIEFQSPREALPLLRTLARLSLCREVHKDYQEQVDDIVEEWTKAIHENSGHYLTNEQTAIQPSYQQVTAERDTRSRQAVELASNLSVAEERLRSLSQELDQFKRECTHRSKQVESLTTRLDSEARSFNKYRAETEIQHKLLSNIVEDLQSQLRHAQQSSKKLNADLKQAIDSKTMLSEENATLHSQSETEHEKCVKLSAEIEKLRLSHAETEAISTELARQSQATAKYRQAKVQLKLSAEAHDALKTASAQKEKEHSVVIATLTGQLNAESKESDRLRQELTITRSSLFETQVKLEILQRDVEASKMTDAEKETVESAMSKQKRHLIATLFVGFTGTLSTKWRNFTVWMKSVRVHKRDLSRESFEMV